MIFIKPCQPTATDVARSMVFVSMCVFSTRVNCAKTAEPINMPFGGQSHEGTRNLVLDGGPDIPKGRALLRGTCASLLYHA